MIWNFLRKLKRKFCRIKNSLVCYRACGVAIEYLEAEQNRSSIKKLPNDFIIPPGKFIWQNHCFELGKEGLYRFIFPEKENCQRVVFSHDVQIFLSSIAWVVSHGHRDDKCSNQQLLNIAKKDKLYVTCERIVQFAMDLLMARGIRCRTVYFEEKTFTSTYDGGHVMIEVWLENSKKWILYDLDMGVYFEKNRSPLSLLEFMENAQKEEYDILLLAKDNTLDVSGFSAKNGFKYHFLMEAVVADLKSWYRKVCQVVIILHEGKRYYLTDGCKHPHSNNIVLDELSFKTKFYSSY